MVGLGYGWLLRSIYGLMAVGSLVAGFAVDPVLIREIATVAVLVALVPSIITSISRRRYGPNGFPSRLDLLAPIFGFIALIIAGLNIGGPAFLAVARTLVGALFLGAVSDCMLLGHWYLVQPGLERRPLIDLVRWTAFLWPLELIVYLLPTGMISVLTGDIDDGYGGLLGWFWGACSVGAIVLLGATRAALKEREYSAVMSATGLLYLTILAVFGMDLVARACLT